MLDRATICSFIIAIVKELRESPIFERTLNLSGQIAWIDAAKNGKLEKIESLSMSEMVYLLMAQHI